LEGGGEGGKEAELVRATDRRPDDEGGKVEHENFRSRHRRRRGKGRDGGEDGPSPRDSSVSRS
jgi:hypothetical protein